MGVSIWVCCTSNNPPPLSTSSFFGIFWQFLSIFVMMTVLSKRYVAPLIKALKPRRHTRTNSRALSLTAENRGKEVPSEADVVVIGGGSLGCQTLYHLAKLGVTDTVLLEKEQLTAGRCTTRGLLEVFHLSSCPGHLSQLVVRT